MSNPSLLRQFNIGKRLSIGFGLLVLISIIVGLVAYFQLNNIKGNLNNIAERRLPAALLVGDMNREFQLKRINILDWLADANGQSNSQFEQNINKAQQAYDEAAKLAENFHKTPAGRAVFEKVLEAKEQYDTQYKTLVALIQQGEREKALLFNRQQLNEAAKTFSARLQELAAYQRDTGNTQRQQAYDSMSQANFSILLSILVATLLGLGLAYAITNSLTGPMANAVTMSETIAAGNLSQDYHDNSPDEAGALIRAMDKMQLQLRETIREISQSSRQLSSTSQELHDVTDQTAQIMQQQSSEVDMAATAVTELTTAIEEVARSAAATSNDSNHADTTAKNGQQQVQQTIVAIQTLEQELQLSRKGVEQLSNRVNEIGSVLDVIRSIAEQTNLLALNAAIEAARAGDSGRGFAVVADEVRALAHRTQESTKVIEQTIRTVQTETQHTVVAMGQSSDKATSTLQLAQQAGDALSRITKAISQISDQNLTIASAAEEQATVAREVDRNLVNIRDLAMQNAAGAHETKVSSESLTLLAKTMDSRVSQFKVG